jgi:hypothetical protein
LDYKNDELLRYLPGEADPQKVDLSSGVSISTSINLKNAGGIYNEIAYFVNCVKAGTPPQVITPQESVDVLSMLLKEIESAKTGHILDI